MPEERLRWGILSTGAIARTFADALAESDTGRLVAVASRAPGPAEAFAQKYGSPRAHGSYAVLLEDPEVEAVYIAPPHPFHAEWCRRAARAGKHILCEKPLTLNASEARQVAQAARDHDVFLMEAFMYRCHPQTARLVQLIREGAIGQVGAIQATFSFCADYQPDSRIFKKELGGGGILDVGCYAMSMARLVAGAAQGQPFANPIRLRGFGLLHPEAGTDLQAVAVAEFPGRILARLAAGVGLAQENEVRVFGTAGHLRVPKPFLIPPAEGLIELFRAGSDRPELVAAPADRSSYALEIDAVGKAIRSRARECAAMPLADSIGNMAALDVWRSEIGLAYPGE